MAWFDNLFAPPMFGQSGGLAPNSYDMFRALYPPHTRPMPEQPQMPYAPPMNPAMPRPMQAPSPNEPRGGTFPGFGPQMTGDIRVGEGDPGLPAGELPWLSSVQQIMSGGMPTDGIALRVNKPNVMPASNPPPMMGRAGELPPGVNPPGAMGMGDLAYPGAMTPPNAQSAAPKPGFWERNADTLGPNGSLWGPLAALGRGMAQPSWYGPMGQLSQGLGEATQAAQAGPMQRAQRRLLEAQVGKAESETQARGLLRDFARQANLPAAVALSLQLSPDKAAEILEKYDPAMRAAYLKFAEEKSAATAKGSSPYDIMKAAAGATNVGIKMGTEYQAKLDNLAKFEGIANDPSKSPAERKNAMDMAQAIRRDLTQKDTPEKGFMDQITGMERGVQGAERLKELVKQYGVSSLNPEGRAKIAQEYSWLITAMKSTEGFGAALTGNEQKILEDGLRNPNNFISNALIGSKTHIGLIEKYINYTKGRAQSLDRLRRSGELPPSLRDETGLPPPPAGFNRIR